jgi:hypothetical protein
LRWQLCEDVLHVGIRVMPIDLGGLDQAHHCCRPLAPSQ